MLRAGTSCSVERSGDGSGLLGASGIPVSQLATRSGPPRAGCRPCSPAGASSASSAWNRVRRPTPPLLLPEAGESREASWSSIWRAVLPASSRSTSATVAMMSWSTSWSISLSAWRKEAAAWSFWMLAGCVGSTWSFGGALTGGRPSLQARRARFNRQAGPRQGPPGLQRCGRQRARTSPHLRARTSGSSPGPARQLEQGRHAAVVAALLPHPRAGPEPPALLTWWDEALGRDLVHQLLLPLVPNGVDGYGRAGGRVPGLAARPALQILLLSATEADGHPRWALAEDALGRRARPEAACGPCGRERIRTRRAVASSQMEVPARNHTPAAACPPPSCAFVQDSPGLLPCLWNPTFASPRRGWSHRGTPGCGP